MARQSAWLFLGLCLLCLGGCLGYRLTPAEVVEHTQAVLNEGSACHSVLELEIDTDMLRDSVSLEIWEQTSEKYKIEVRSAVNPQLQGLAFTTDGKQSMSYSPHTGQALIGPADRVRLPLVLETLLRSRLNWVRNADPDTARLVAREREEGLVVYRVQIPLPEGGQAQYAIDARQWWVRQVEYQDAYLGRGQVSVREMECFAELPDASLALDLAEGVPIKEVAIEESWPLTIAEAQMAVAFPLHIPAYLPSGTDFTVAYQLEKNLALVYGGEHPFTLVQGPGMAQVLQENATTVPLRGVQATLISDTEHGGMVLTWREDDLQFSISGSLQQPEIIRIAESLELASKNAEPGQDVR
jgi:hypothetical protein